MYAGVMAEIATTVRFPLLSVNDVLYIFVSFQDGVTSEIIALAQGFMDIAEIMSKVKGVSE